MRTSINIPGVRLGEDRTRVNKGRGTVEILGARVYNKFELESFQKTDDETVRPNNSKMEIAF